ncbi:hypothetical protein EBQ81_04520 [bacterium]|nr:hypothetical protein [bacterium]
MAHNTAKVNVYYYLFGENYSDATRLVPAPIININPEIYYANDSVIGYTYNVVLKGYANALRLNERPDNASSYGLGQVISHMDHIRKIFSANGGKLYVKDTNNLNNDILVAKGATIKNITFEPSDNLWTDYAPYTIEIEFNEIDFIGCSNETNDIIYCNNTFFHIPQSGTNVLSSGTLPSPYLVDIKKYKIKEFSDSFSFNLDNEVYTELPSIINHNFSVTYDVNATGKNFYMDDRLIPSWEMAKLFCQNRLVTQISGLFNKTLSVINPINYETHKAIDTPNEIFNNINPYSGTHSGLINLESTYKIYNEVISCNTSESDGSFGLTYSAIFKKYDKLKNDDANSALHNFTKTVSHTDDDQQQVTISVQGNVQGLVEGGLISDLNKDDFELPANGTFIGKKTTDKTKYDYAKTAFLSYIQSNTGDDLNNQLKALLDITNSGLLLIDNNSQPRTGQPKPTSFVVDHNYHEGSIDYTATYDSINSSTLDLGYTNISITRTFPTDIIQEFIIPGRAAGPIIQKLNMRNPGKISIKVDGMSPKNISSNSNIVPCNSIPDYSDIIGIENIIAIDSHSDYIKTLEEYTKNNIDGSFSISLEYLCRKS